ncbi:hypothetical protein ABVT39_012141 [Epinephelus coioides]
MSRLQGLKTFINQRLTAAVEDIFGHLERTITEYEEDMDRRHRKLLDKIKQRTEAEQNGPKLAALRHDVITNV